jgi:hypothetical protein
MRGYVGHLYTNSFIAFVPVFSPRALKVLVAAGDGAIMADRSGPGRQWPMAASGPFGVPQASELPYEFLSLSLRTEPDYQSDLALR